MEVCYLFLTSAPLPLFMETELTQQAEALVIMLCAELEKFSSQLHM